VGIKIVYIVGSNRLKGNTYHLVKHMFDNLPDNIETEILQVAEFTVKPCELCFEDCAVEPLSG